MENIEKIKELTRVYEERQKAMANLNEVLDNFETGLEAMNELEDYYYSEDFQEDYDKSNKGDFPENMDQTILGEDAIYNLLGDEYYLGLRLLDLANKLIQPR